MYSSKDISQALSQLGRKLIQINYVNLAQMQQAAAATRTGQPLIEVLQEITGRPVPMDLVQQHTKQHPFIVKSLYGVEFLSREQISLEELISLINQVIPLAFCRRYQILPIGQTKAHTLMLVMVEPNNSKTKQELQSLLASENIQPQYFGISQEDYAELLNQYNKKKRIPKNQEIEIEKALEETQINIGEIVDDILDADLEEEPVSVQRNFSPKESAIVILVEKILNEAIEKKATQIQIEPNNKSVIVQFEEDGIFSPTIEEPLSLDLLPTIISYLKKLANIDTTSEEVSTLKGRLRFRVNSRPVEFWLTFSSGEYGQKISLRLLNQSSTLSLGELVSDQKVKKTLHNLLEKPSGLIIVTGTNRLGIINTLYSILLQCKQTKVNIITVEEPVERIIPGLTQLEVEQDRNRNHASILQGVLSEDVDTIMVDNVPDAMTAKIILDVTRKGRLVLVGLQGQGCSEGISQLLEQDVQPNTVAEQLIGVIHHRYMRSLCPVCRLAHVPSPQQLAQFGLSASSPGKISFYKAKTLSPEEIIQARSKGRLCRNCNGLGYRGQISVYDSLEVTPSLKRIIAQRPNKTFLANAIEQENTKSSIAYAIDFVQQGLTTLEEVERIFADKLKEYAKVVTIGKEITSVPLVNQRIEKIEGLLMGLLHEFQQLKQAVKGEDTGVEASQDELIAELSSDAHPDLDPSKQTIASSSAFYEELVGPGEWDELRNELNIDKETIAADFSLYEEDIPRPPRRSTPGSVPDPW